MTRKLRQEFVFHYPLKHKVVRDLKIVTEQVGELVVEGLGYFDPSASILTDIEDRYAADIDFIKWNGTDIKSVLEVCGGLEEIEEATIRHLASVFENKEPVLGGEVSHPQPVNMTFLQALE
ncbi:MAG TPA: hypothetical protein VM888_02800, partial [Chitinophagaceae bacterium]|nr:hypothetical protein [Chitinophagaceae bacterium]